MLHFSFGTFLWLALTSVVNGITCHEWKSCASSVQSESGSTAIQCYGYQSCWNSSILVTGTEDIECNGAYSCAQTTVQQDGDEDIYCNGFQSCSHSIVSCVNRIYGLGASSLVNSSVTITNNVNGYLYCCGDRSCADSFIVGGKWYFMYGHLSGQNSIFQSSGSGVNYYFSGTRSGQNATVVCGHTCNVYCHGNGCHGINLTCIDTCTLNIGCVRAEYDDYVCPGGYKLSSFMGDIYLPDISNISQIYNDYETVLQDCSNQATGQCNDYQGCAGRELKNKSICCSAAQGCENVVSVVPDDSFSLNTFVRCDGYNSCGKIANGILTTEISKYSHSIIYFGGYYNPTNYDNIYGLFVDGGTNVDIVCSGYRSCRYGTLTNADNLYCSGYSSCDSGLMYNISNVYAYGHWAAHSSTITNADNVYCGSGGCYQSNINNVYDSVYCYGSKSVYDRSIENSTNVFIFGEEIAYRADIVNVQKLYCDGTYTCGFATITNVSIIEANGSNALENATITSGGNGNKMFVALHGDVVSTNNTLIICQTGDTCVIDCNNNNITDICNIINFRCDGICVFNATEAPTTIPTIPTYILTDNPTSASPSSSPSASPSVLPSIAPSLTPSSPPSSTPSSPPSGSPSVLPRVAPSLSPSSSPTIDYYFYLFNHSYSLDLLFGSTKSKHNTTSLKRNEILQTDMIDEFEESSYSAITNQKTRILETKIKKIWTYNGNNVNDSCQLKNISGDNVNKYESISGDDETLYLSWIRFEVKFKSQDIKSDWETSLQTIIRFFRSDLSKHSYFINDTISIYYCQLTNVLSDEITITIKENDPFVVFSVIVPIVVLSLFCLLSLFGFIDSIFRRNEIFSIFAAMPPATYILDFVSGLCFVFVCFTRVLFAVKKEQRTKTMYRFTNALCCLTSMFFFVWLVYFVTLRAVHVFFRLWLFCDRFDFLAVLCE